MSEPDPVQNRRIEELVRESLERAAEQIDPRPLFERIQSLMASEGVDHARTSDSRPTPTLSPRSSPAAHRGGVKHRLGQWWSVAAGVTILVASVVLVLQNRPLLAKGEVLVREARQAHRLPIDRCYLVEVRRETALVAELSPTPPQVRMNRLWTRGDRFWVESVRPDHQWAWGRDVSNRFWIAFDPHTALRMEAEEIPFWLSLYCDLHSLRVDQLLGDLLSHFDVTREADESSLTSTAIRVSAKARFTPLSYPSIQTAELEIDAETRVLRRMVLRRVWKGEPFATITYTLTDTDALDTDAYQLEGHLAEPVEIATREHSPERLEELLARWLGPNAAKWFRKPPSLNQP